jgi:hypothetical protein
MKAKFVGLILALTLLLAHCAVAQVTGKDDCKFDPNLPYQGERSDPATHDVDFSVVVTPPNHCKVLKVWLPEPQSDRGQQVLGLSQFSTFPQSVTPKIGRDPKFGNKFATAIDAPISEFFSEMKKGRSRGCP